MTAALSGLRLQPVPVSEPPYDDEIERTGQISTDLPFTPRPRNATDYTQGTLTLSFTLGSGVPATPEAPATPVRSKTTPENAGERAEPHSRPPARAWAGRFVQALVEVLAGLRPTTQLARWTSSEVYAEVRRRSAVPGGWAAGAGGNDRPVVRSVRLAHPRADVAEVSAVVHRAERARAIALRLEGTAERWQCTELELG